MSACQARWDGDVDLLSVINVDATGYFLVSQYYNILLYYIIILLYCNTLHFKYCSVI
eukprot:COSAG01_NODE_12649_length_1704_cov_1.520249_1_plen_57_part_00